MNVNPTVTPVIGTAQADALAGSNRSEVISGRQEDDVITGNAGNDIGYGGSGDDTLIGGQGADVLYGGGGPSMADMTTFSIAEDYTGTVTFLNEGAGFRNTLGMYRVDEDGVIQSVEILFANASALGSGGDLQRGHSDVEVGLSAGDWIGFFILPNGFGQNGETLESGTYVIRDANGDLASVSTPGATTLFRIDPVTGAEIPVQSQYGTALFHSAADPSDGYALNPDSYPHTVGHVDADNGTIVIGFEDLWNGGDRDYDDVVLSIDVGLSNASVLDPNIVAPDSADDGAGWVYGEDGQRYDLDGNPLASENDVISGGSGDDRILGMAGHDTLEGGRGNDSLNGNSGDDTLRGDGGRDELSGGRGEDVLHGGDGNDLLDGNSGDDWLSGGRGNDTLTGSSGDDTVFGGSGSDTGSGGSGDDDLFGESGNDTLSGGSGHDQIEGGSGSDVLDGGQGDDSLSGGSGADRLKGGSGDDSLIGGDGKDYLNGGSGDDILDGGAGNDRFYLGEGNDHVTGGTGSDRFVFRADGQGATTVVISDYRHQGGELDTLDLRALDLLGSGLSAEDWIAQHVTLNDDSGVSVDLGVCNVLFEARPDASASNLYDEICDGLLFF